MQKSLIPSVFDLSRDKKKLVLMAADGLILMVSLALTMTLRFGLEPTAVEFDHGWLYPLVLVTGVGTFWILGLYSVMIRSIEQSAVVQIVAGAAVASFSIAAWAALNPDILVPRSVPILYFLLVVLCVGGLRMALRGFFHAALRSQTSAESVAIFGAGDAGREIAAFVANTADYDLIGFIDNDPTLQKMRIRNRWVYPESSIQELREKYGLQHILLARPELKDEEKREIVERLASTGLSIHIAPPLSDLLSSGGRKAAMKPIRIEDLLGRDAVAPIDGLIEKGLEGKTVLVTGGAGSIGSQICLQVLLARPKRLIALDVSEVGLYSLIQMIDETKITEGVEVIPQLGSVLDQTCIERLIREHEVDIIYHAAAYKHVPIVEDNILSGTQNNVLGTKIVAEAAVAAEIERFVLVSTDKAVRPTNVMGATKRAAELVVQDLQTRAPKTILSMVRFGNVLGSSGSVIPLFNKQIAAGGPVTLTHKDVTRYFMTIAEAAQLVLQAGFLAKGGDVFVLDMGKPVKLQEIAELMIRLSGNRVAERADDPNGIFIKVVGLRPGEKLYEELLIGNDVSRTDHPKIMWATEHKMTARATKAMVEKLTECIQKGDADTIVAELERVASLNRNLNL